MVVVKNSHVCAFLLLVLHTVTEVQSSQYSYGKEAKKLCQAYKKICPRGKVCAIQTIHFPRDMKFPVCVHRHTVKVRSRVCQLAPSPGKCQAQFRRWYYNVHTATCSWFTYSGCAGNGNNFRTRHDCEAICITGPRERGHHHGPAHTGDVTHRRDETLYPRHEDIASRPRHDNLRRDHDPGPTRLSPSVGGYESERRRGFYAGGSANGVYGTIDTVATTEGPATQRDWRSRRRHPFSRSHSRHRTSPLEHRGSPVELGRTYDTPETNPEEKGLRRVRRPGDGGRIRTRPRPLYRQRGETDSRLSSLQERPRATVDRQTSPRVADRKLKDVSDISRSLVDFSSKSNKRRLEDRPHPDRSRAEDTKKRLSELAYQAPQLPTISIRRRGPSSFSRQPIRTLSLLGPQPLAASPDTNDVSADGVTSSSLVSSYASNAQEAVRRFPQTRRRKPRRERGRKKKRGRGRRRNKGSKKNSRRRRRKNRRRGDKRRKPTKSGSPPDSARANNSNDTVDGEAENRSRVSSSDKDKAVGDNARSIFAEHRQNKPSFWPYKPREQNDAKAQSLNERIGNSQNEIHKEKDDRKGKRKGGRRRRKGKGKRKMRGDDDLREDRDGPVKPSDDVDGDDGGDESNPQDLPVNQYYEKVHLFGVLDNAYNETDHMT